ncbi:hypothetical protein [Cellulomonas sp. WB94]|uniref:hypothetical protein n=1 Tax=Cellulomonas sp. WB94 TaxID=2173174 RepID=UPI001304F073|nr:hypothetical protein [Cellulomonas sp. WB94]
MNKWRWVFVGAGLAGFVVLAVLISTESPYAAWFGNAFWAFVVLGAIAQMIRSQRSTGHAAPAVRPGFQGLGEVQDIALGRTPMPPVTYGSDDGVVPTEVSTRTDPLDDPVWTVGPASPSAGPTSPGDRS